MKRLFAADMVRIIDAEPDCECDCCGRKLKLGAVINTGHTVGVDCLAEMTLADRWLGRARGWKRVPGADHRQVLKRLSAARQRLQGGEPSGPLKVRAEYRADAAE